MIQEVLSFIFNVIGVGNDDLTVWQIGLRAFLIYLTAILLIKFGEKRFMGQSTAFDMILGIILGSVLSRAITGNPSFFDGVGVGVILVGIHWLFAFVSYNSDWMGSLIKGNAKILVKDGEIQWDNMRKSHISKKDLEMALYSNGKVTEPSQVKVARFERSGDISVIPREKQKKISVVEITVHEGVQKVRLELSEDT
jgi:uncharacterized membrane protein YcaP (DUF421 family)